MSPLWLLVSGAGLCGPFCDSLGGHADGALLKRYADSAGVPLALALAHAAVESGHQGGNHWKGASGEIGRMQIRPALWKRSFRTECGTRPLTDYATNVCKGMFILRHWHDETGSWLAASRRYNGTGSAGRRYVTRMRRELTVLASQGIEDPPSPGSSG